MVQGERSGFTAVEGVYNRSQDSKRTGFENMQKREKEHRASTSVKASAASSWGPIFKNREHFNSLHHC
uniref:Uncharacterized protein n=1 Tax=Phlebotomus papatasi TaxID=29031 RepID=A0A1B0DLM8_PHLPP